MVDLYHNIYDGEIFQQSRCIWHENTLMDFFRSALLNMGYHSVSDSNKVYRCNDRTVVICLVDDFSTCSTEYSTALPYLFDPNTVVITDNWCAVPTQYTVLQLPTSFFGIYQHQPAAPAWQPDRRFNFSVNRLDTKRMLLMLELWHRSRYNPDADLQDLINFNCWSWNGDNKSDLGLRSNFEQQWQQLDSQYHSVYQETYDDLVPRMPLRNHDLSHEASHVHAWINIVMETYSSDTTVALSEKIFRAMCMPVPWMVYSGRNTVAYLHSLGFDVMRDVIEHRYDGMIENKTAAYGDKMVDFLFEATDFVQAAQTNDDLAARCQSAANTNRRLLTNMAQQWPRDFANWWPKALAKIQ